MHLSYAGIICPSLDIERHMNRWKMKVKVIEKKQIKSNNQEPFRLQKRKLKKPIGLSLYIM